MRPLLPGAPPGSRCHGPPLRRVTTQSILRSVAYRTRPLIQIQLFATNCALLIFAMDTLCWIKTTQLGVPLLLTKLRMTFLALEEEFFWLLEDSM
mmetsp:Transcript_65934/g.137309  ORF Transcript_65934/g.137309 Transcript_65934/m.137309 type:complete len:95 (-) Transcript_65934:275-559(-)